MSQLIRFKYKNVYIKSRIYEQSSKKLECACCGQKRFGILVRHIEPNKIPDSLICNECIALISLQEPISIDKDYKFGKFSPRIIINTARIREPLKRGPKPKKFERPRDKRCPYCEEFFSAQGLPTHIKVNHPDKTVPEMPIEEEPEELEAEIIEEEQDDNGQESE